MSAPLYYIKGGSLSFADKILLNNAEFYLYRHDRICLIGRNGCGKSSLLKVVTGEYELDSGEIFADPYTSFGYLRQDNGTLPDQTGLEFILDKLVEHEYRYKADMLLENLELDGKEKLANLSGGQLRRIFLAKLLVQEPDVLLLDEPTNHLDIKMIEWLEEYVKSYPGAVICISHDRRFLTNITNKIWWLDRTILRKSERGFKYFDEWQEQVLTQEAAELERLNKQMQAENVWLSQGVTARRKRNQRRLGQLYAMREKLQSSRERMRKATLAIDPLVVSEVKKSKFLVEMEGVNFKYATTPIIKDLSLRIEKGEKIGVIGPNGSGKSTFIKLLVGELNVDSGKLRYGANLEITYFDQHRTTLNPEHSLKLTLCPNGGDHVFLPDGREMHVAGYLKNFMFHPKELYAKTSTLSGGEVNRLLLAKALINPGNLLVLDEPTNDLDMDSLEVLVEIISEYQGAVVIVSHDRDFLDRLVTRSLVFTAEREVFDLVGGYDEFMKIRPARQEKTHPKIKKVPQERQSQTPTKLSYQENRSLEIIPKQIEELEARNKIIELELSSADLYIKKPEYFMALSQELSGNKMQIEELTERWLEIEAKRENFC